MEADPQSLALHLSDARRRCDAETGSLLSASRCYCCFGKLVVGMDGANMVDIHYAQGGDVSNLNFNQCQSPLVP